MAEYLGVTDEYFRECIEDYKRQYGLSCRLGKYYITLEPRLMNDLGFPHKCGKWDI
ncbi:MAG TPA: hypothetical protein GX708_06025 [Gallicola sp.]|nr:hypothetical protein [Gallicola sp.]